MQSVKGTRRIGLSGRFWRWAAIAAGALALAGVQTATPSGPVHGQGTDPAAAHRAFVEAVNREDIDGALALMTDDAVYAGTPGCPLPDGCRTKEAIRADLARGAAIDVRYTTLNQEVNGSTITGRFETRAPIFAAQGFERVVLTYTVEIRDGKVALLRGVFDLDDPLTVRFVADLTRQANVAVVRRIYAAYDARDFATIRGLYAADVLDHQPGPSEVRGADAVADGLAAVARAFPDMQVTLDAVIAEGDTVVVRGVVSGTHTGPLLTIPPTGRSVRFAYTDVYKLSGGKVTEVWHGPDFLGLFAQLGLIPGLGMTPAS